MPSNEKEMKKKSKLTDQQKKIIDIALIAVQVVIVILAITISAIVLANPIGTSATVGKGATKLLPVLTDSMQGDLKTSFQAGDLVIAKDPSKIDLATLKAQDLANGIEGDIITFVMPINGTDQLNTHRIIETGVDGLGRRYFYTKGDADTKNERDQIVVYSTDVLAVYQSHLKGVGKTINWMQKPTNFLLVIVIPLAVLFIYNIVLLIRMIMQSKISKVQSEKLALEAEKAALQLDEEEIKRRAIEEFLQSQDGSNDKAE